MKTIDIIVQGAELPDIIVGKADAAQTVLQAITALKVPGMDQKALLIFAEEGDEPLVPDTALEALLAADAVRTGVSVLKLHVTRCRHIEVSVHYNGEVANHRFSPAATVGRVHQWAAKHFGLAPRDAAEHVLQLHGTTKRPDRDVHVGSLTTGTVCAVAFDLVPRKRVEG